MEKICEKLSIQSKYHTVDIVKDMQVEFDIKVNYWKAFHAKE